MDLIPAIDLLDGEAVRLVRGDYGRRAASVTDPHQTVRTWVEAGVRWLHIVDLGGARDGRPVDLATASELASAARSTNADVRVELGGGLRDLDAIEAALGAGIDVAILGTAAIEDEALLSAAVERWPGRVAVSVDVRDGRVALDGWTREADADPIALARALTKQPISHLIVTDVQRDGTRRGPNLDLLARMRAAVPDARLVAAGGVGSAEALHDLAAAGVDGAIVGLALVDGSLLIEDALAAAAEPVRA